MTNRSNLRTPKLAPAAALACVVGLGAAVPASSLSIIPAPLCEVNPSSGHVYPIGAGPSTAVGAGEATVGDGIVMWDYDTPNGGIAAVIRVCRSGQEMRVTFPNDPQYTAFDRFSDMVFGQAAYTLGAIQNEMNGMGASAERTRNTYGSCVCDAAGY